VDAQRLEPFDIGTGEDAGFGDDGNLRWYEGTQPLRGGEVDLEGAEVAVVDADDGSAGHERALHLQLVVHLHEGVHIERPCKSDQLGKEGGVEDGGDEEDGVGAVDAGLVELVVVEQEVLAQEGRALGEGVADGGEVVQGALEVGLVGENGYGGGPRAGVGAGQRDGVELLAQEAAGGGCLLDLGDEADGIATERVGEGAQGRGLAQAGLQIGEGDAALGGGQLLPLVGYFDLSGNLDTALAIRTIVMKDGVAHAQAAGGIVFDSVPELEYMESQNKARAMLRAIDQAELIEEAVPSGSLGY